MQHKCTADREENRVIVQLTVPVPLWDVCHYIFKAIISW